MKSVSFVRNIFVDMKHDGCFDSAASIAYFSLLSFIPMVFLISTTVGFVTGSNLTVTKKVYVLISPYLPNLTYELWQKLTGWFSRSSYTLNVFSVVVLVLSSTLVFNSIDRSLREIFRKFIVRRRSSVESLLIYFGLILFLILIVFLFMSLDLGLLFLKKLSRIDELSFLRPLVRKFGLIVPVASVALQTATLTLVFRFLISRSLPWKKVTGASFFIVVMWLIAIKAFSLYVEYVPTYNVIYGSMSVFIVFLTWTYYSALIFLLGAELLKQMLSHDA